MTPVLIGSDRPRILGASRVFAWARTGSIRDDDIGVGFLQLAVIVMDIRHVRGRDIVQIHIPIFIEEKERLIEPEEGVRIGEQARLVPIDYAAIVIKRGGIGVDAESLIVTVRIEIARISVVCPGIDADDVYGIVHEIITAIFPSGNVNARIGIEDPVGAIVDPDIARV
jgi:hypothetical protein